MSGAAPDTPFRILLVGPQPLVVKALEAHLDGGRFEIAGVALDSDEAGAKAEALLPDAVLIDTTQGDLDLVDAMRRVAGQRALADGDRAERRGHRAAFRRGRTGRDRSIRTEAGGPARAARHARASGHAHDRHLPGEVRAVAGQAALFRLASVVSLSSRTSGDADSSRASAPNLSSRSLLTTKAAAPAASTAET